MSINLTSSSGRIVLVAISDEWRLQVQQILEQNGYSAVMAVSEDEARAALQAGQLNCAVITSDWAMAHEGRKAGLLQLALGKIPTVCLVTESIWQNARERWLEEVYHPPLHEYCSTPFAADELLTRLNAVIAKAENLEAVNGQTGRP